MILFSRAEARDELLLRAGWAAEPGLSASNWLTHRWRWGWSPVVCRLSHWAQQHGHTESRNRRLKNSGALKSETRGAFGENCIFPPWKMLNNSNKLPFFGFGTSNGRDDNHNDKSNTSYYTKDSSIAALEAFQRDYLPSASGAPGQRLAPVSLSSLRPPSPPSPGPRPPSSSPSLGHLGHQSHAFDEQFKDVSSHLFIFSNLDKKFISALRNRW